MIGERPRRTPTAVPPTSSAESTPRSTVAIVRHGGCASVSEAASRRLLGAAGSCRVRSTSPPRRAGGGWAVERGDARRVTPARLAGRTADRLLAGRSRGVRCACAGCSRRRAMLVRGTGCGSRSADIARSVDTPRSASFGGLTGVPSESLPRARAAAAGSPDGSVSRLVAAVATARCDDSAPALSATGAAAGGVGGAGSTRTGAGSAGTSACAGGAGKGVGTGAGEEEVSAGGSGGGGTSGALGGSRASGST